MGKEQAARRQNDPLCLEIGHIPKVLRIRIRKSAKTCKPVLYSVRLSAEPHVGRGGLSCRLDNFCSRVEVESSSSPLSVS